MSSPEREGFDTPRIASQACRDARAVGRVQTGVIIRVIDRGTIVSPESFADKMMVGYSLLLFVDTFGKAK